MLKNYDVLCILSNALNKNCELNLKSRARVDLAAKIYSKQVKKPKLIVSGWKYRKDCNLSLADTFENYLIKKKYVSKKDIFKEHKPRDTIGEAIFCFRRINKIKNIKKLCVITHKSHLKRARYIFNFIFNNKYKIKFECIDEYISEKIKNNESKSLINFKKTFKDINKGDINKIMEIVLNKHPNYNGTNYNKVNLNVFKS